MLLLVAELSFSSIILSEGTCLSLCTRVEARLFTVFSLSSFIELRMHVFGARSCEKERHGDAIVKGRVAKI